MEQIVSQVLLATAQRDWEELRRLLHPYLHWSEHGGVKLRGRRNVLSWLATRQGSLAPPERVELRDGQVYRWLG